MELLGLEVRMRQQWTGGGPSQPGQELRDREDFRIELLRLEVRMRQQRTGGGPSQPGTEAQG